MTADTTTAPVLVTHLEDPKTGIFYAVDGISRDGKTLLAIAIVAKRQPDGEAAIVEFNGSHIAVSKDTLIYRVNGGKRRMTAVSEDYARHNLVLALEGAEAQSRRRSEAQAQALTRLTEDWEYANQTGRSTIQVDGSFFRVELAEIRYGAEGHWYATGHYTRREVEQFPALSSVEIEMAALFVGRNDVGETYQTSASFNRRMAAGDLGVERVEEWHVIAAALGNLIRY